MERIAEDLKSRSVEDLQQVLGEVAYSPFHHLDDRKDHSPPLDLPTGWLIAEDIPARGLAAANKLAHQAIQGGAQSLRFIMDEVPGGHRIEGLLSGVDVENVRVHFFEENKNANPLSLARHFYHLLVHQKLNAGDVAGAIGWTVDATVVPDDVAELMEFCRAHLPLLKVLPVNGHRFYEGPERTVEELTAILQQADQWLTALCAKGFSEEEVFQNMHVTVMVDKHYFVTVTKLRALRMLWAQLAKTWGWGAAPLYLDAYFAAYTMGSDPYDNLVAATTQALSAATGGVSRLTVLPSDVHDARHDVSTPFFRRMARNVQHILQHESFIGSVSDAAAGSYFFEDLTERLAANAWERFANSF